MMREHAVIADTLAHAHALYGAPRELVASLARAAPVWRAAFDVRDALVAARIAGRGREQAYDVVIVGGGLLALHVEASVRALRPEASVLIVDAASGARPYDDAGAAFLLNTDRERHQLPRVRLADLDAARFAPAIIMHDAFRASAALGEVDLWCDARVVEVTGRPDDFLLSVVHGGHTFSVKAAELVIATGFGAPACSALDPSLRDDARLMPALAPAVPNALSAEAFLAHAAWGSPFNTSTKPVVVIGDGPSALAVLSLFAGEIPRTLFPTASHGELFASRIVWLTGDEPNVAAVARGLDGDSAIAHTLTERYAGLFARLAERERNAALEVRAERGSARVRFGRLVANGVEAGLVIDATGYAAGQLPGSFADLRRDECSIVDNVVRGRGAWFVGDCVGAWLSEDLAQGPLEQWAEVAQRTGAQLARELTPRYPLPRVHDGAQVAAAGALTVPRIACAFSADDAHAARWALTLSGVTIAHRTPRELIFSACPPWLTNALRPRVRSILAQLY